MLPDSIEKGKYDIEIGMRAPKYPCVYFATTAKEDDGFYLVGNIDIE